MIVFPDPETANEDGLLAVGGNLEPETLMGAYRQGIFPWFDERTPILWWAPDPRMVLFPAEFHCSRRLARRMRQSGWRFSWDEDFEAVIRACAGPRGEGNGTWLLPQMIEAYRRLHALGLAHSVEVWFGQELAGGLYGVLQHGVFFAESMFHRRTDASKMALAYLVERAITMSWKVIDCQFHTGHLQSLGARTIPRHAFLELLHRDAPGFRR
jgi:leucyl/phenylalanyl-tRNA---protein transferase